MKRKGYLYNKIISIENLIQAEKKARKGSKNLKSILEKVPETEFPFKAEIININSGYSIK